MKKVRIVSRAEGTFIERILDGKVIERIDLELGELKITFSRDAFQSECVISEF